LTERLETSYILAMSTWQHCLLLPISCK